MTREEMHKQKHVSVKIVLTNDLNDRLLRVAKEIGCRKSQMIRQILTDGLNENYEEI